MKNIIQQRKKTVLAYITGIFILTGYSGCDKADYLDIDAGERPPLSAKVKLVNALSKNVAIHFWDFTRQLTNEAILQNGFSEDYLDTQYGKVQFNVTEGESTTYKASYLFGGSANFIQETDKSSYSGPNGPIATFYHTLFAVDKRTSSKLNPGNIDSLILVYDDLAVPAAGKVKIRFANFDTLHPLVSVKSSTGEALFSHVAYGEFGDQVAIVYDENGQSPSEIPGLEWKTLGPFKEIDPQNVGSLHLVDATGADLDISAFHNLNLEPGQIYSLFITNDAQSDRIVGTIVRHLD